MTLQELLDHQGFIVLAYCDTISLAQDLERGFTDGNTEGEMDGIRAHIIGESSFEEWVTQCHLVGDCVGVRKEQVGYVRVIVE